MTNSGLGAEFLRRAKPVSEELADGLLRISLAGDMDGVELILRDYSMSISKTGPQVITRI
jgi:hypothetical protein